MAGLGISDIDKTKISFTVGFFEAKSQEYDAFQDLGLPFNGSIVDSETGKKLEVCHDATASVVGYQLTVLTNNKNSPAPLSERVLEGLNLLKMED